jgi:hypothetical protein
MAGSVYRQKPRRSELDQIKDIDSAAPVIIVAGAVIRSGAGSIHPIMTENGKILKIYNAVAGINNFDLVTV